MNFRDSSRPKPQRMELALKSIEKPLIENKELCSVRTEMVFEVGTRETEVPVEDVNGLNLYR